MGISLATKILHYIEENKQFTMPDLYREFGDAYKKHSIRARVYENLKGSVIRTGKGSYIFAGAEIEAIVEQADSRKHVFEIKKANIFYDLAFLDIPYKMAGQRGGGAEITVEELAAIVEEELQLKAVGPLVRSFVDQGKKALLEDIIPFLKMRGNRDAISAALNESLVHCYY